jgi:hypothetical protein
MSSVSIEVSPDVCEMIDGFDATSPTQVRVSRLPDAISALNQLMESLPDQYGWRFKTAEALNAQRRQAAETGASVQDLNTIYWRDVLSNVEAYSVTSVWRMRDLTRSVLGELAQENVIAACILARSALESSIQLVHDARTFSATLDGVRKRDLTQEVVVSKELEEKILKTVFASRLSGADEIYKSTNILSVIEKIAKLAPLEPLSEQYELLCEVTHPNFLGRSIYLIDKRTTDHDGDEIRVVAPGVGLNSAALLQPALWALSWAVEAECTATQLQQQAVRAMFESFPWLGSTATH